MTTTFFPKTGSSGNVTITSGGSSGFGTTSITGAVGAGGFGGSGTITLNSTGTGYYNTVIGGGGAGQVYTTNGTTTSWTNQSSNFSDGTNTVLSVPYGGNKVILEKSAELEVKGKVKINGIDLEERLKTIEEVLNIPTRDVTMEAKYPKLKTLYDQYMKELAKYRTWDSIKGNDE